MVIFIGVNRLLSNVLTQPWFLSALGISLVLGIAVIIWRKRKNTNTGDAKVLPAPLSIPSYRESLANLNPELERARRYGHSLSIAVVRIKSDNLLPKNLNGSFSVNNKWFSYQFISSFIGQLLQENLRGCDSVTYDVTHNYYVILFAETSRNQADKVMQRFQKMIQQRTQLDIHYGISEFPQNGILIQDLVKKAY